VGIDPTAATYRDQPAANKVGPSTSTNTKLVKNTVENEYRSRQSEKQGRMYALRPTK